MKTRYLAAAAGLVLLGILASAAPRPSQTEEADRRHALTKPVRGFEGSTDPDDYARVDRSTFRSIRLRIAKPNGSTCEVQLLRPTAWVRHTGARVGGQVWLSLPEQGVVGYADVLAVGPLPASFRPAAPDGPLRTVTGRFKHTASELVEVRFRGEAGSITCTPNHRFFSDQRGWIQAGKLVPGEPVLTAAEEAAVVQEVGRIRGGGTVYNLEVHRSHTYFVSAEADCAPVWVHNSCFKPTADQVQAYALSANRPFKPGSRLTHAGRALQKHTSRADSGAFKASSRSPKGYNREANAIVEGILTAPGTRFTRRTIKVDGRPKEVVDVVAADGRGLRFDETRLIGFREPPKGT